MRRNLKFKIEIAIRPAIGPGLPLIDHAHLIAIVHASWNADLFLDGFALQAAAAANIAGCTDDLAAPLTIRTGNYLNHGTQKGLVHLTNFSLPLAGGTGGHISAWFPAIAIAMGAFFIAGYLDFLFNAKNSFFEGQF